MPKLKATLKLKRLKKKWKQKLSKSEYRKKIGKIKRKAVKKYAEKERIDAVRSCSYKIFGIGNGRTGTGSLLEALKILGYELIRSGETVPHRKLNRYNGGVDNAFAMNFKELDKRYPGSKFIYTHRGMDSWLDCCKRNIKNKRPAKEGSPLHRARIAMLGYDQGVGYREDTLKKAYLAHQQKVMDYFKGREKDLLIINIVGGEGWVKLCPFLNRSIPNKSFPWGNKGKKKLKKEDEKCQE